MRVLFICGCYSSEILARENVDTMDSVAYDHEGFLVCVAHHERRYGWRSLPNLPGVKVANYRAASFSELEREAFEVFGELTKLDRNSPIDSTMPDRRDARDPEALGNVILLRRLQAEPREWSNEPSDPVEDAQRLAKQNHTAPSRSLMPPVHGTDPLPQSVRFPRMSEHELNHRRDVKADPTP